MPTFIQQLIIYEAANKNAGRIVDAYSLLHHANVFEGDYPEALSPFIYCSDNAMRAEARKLMKRCFARGCVNGQPDLSSFRDHIVGNYQKRHIAEPLKRVLFESYPNAAMLLFHTEAADDQHVWFRRRERIVANALYEKQWLGGISGEKVDDSTAVALRELGESKYWWSRIFVAEIMAQNKEFRDAEVLKRLRDDDNELVRNSARSIENPDPLRATPVDR